LAWPSHDDLSRAERRLRSYDRALRLRVSQEQENTILLERKTFRGVIGNTGPQNLLWRPDTGHRKEEGHVVVGSVHAAVFEVEDLLDALKHADTWQRWSRNAVPLWRQVEEREAREKAARVRTRQDTLRYKSSELFDRYVWKYRQRISVPGQIS